MRRAILAMLGVVPTVALCADFTVSGTVDVSPPPACVAGVCQSLRAALIAANAAAGADTITLPSGTHQLAIAGAGEDLAATGDLDVLDDVTIIGAGQAVTIIDAAGLDRVFHVLDGALTLNGVTVRRGQVTGENGGGILVFAVEGGIGPDEEGTTALTLLDSTVADSTAIPLPPVTPGGEPVGGAGGGIHSSALLTLDGAAIRGNVAGTNGGGLYAGAIVQLARSAITGNRAENGGGVFETGSHVSTYSACAIVGNRATGGGGMSTRTNASILLTNCTIDGNSATDVGAGINAAGPVNLANSTVTGNRSDSDAPNGGAGLNAFSGGTFRLWNTILARNTVASVETPVVRNCGCTGGAGCSAGVQFLSIATNLEDGNGCGLVPAAGDLVNTNPGLAPLGSYGGPTPTRAIGPGSPAIDAGTNLQGAFQCPDQDQRGTTRPLDGDGNAAARCDIGAVEFDPLLDPARVPIFVDGFEPF
jgi:hypothetical protein